jgi:filamentous hemagglutinin
VQSLFAASIGAIATPIGASTRFISNVLLGGAGGAVNTAFNNTYYGDSNSVLYAGGLGVLAGAGGYFFGWASTQGVASLSRPMIYPNLNPKIPILFQGVQNPFPGFAGTTAGSIVGGASSFVPGKEVRK